uniref:Uncharacterized protein n=1 Tax=Schistosoma haematobium TaxID=6185 RepID=A0A094ZIY3_SCHHA
MSELKFNNKANLQSVTAKPNPNLPVTITS